MIGGHVEGETASASKEERGCLRYKIYIITKLIDDKKKMQKERTDSQVGDAR